MPADQNTKCRTIDWIGKAIASVAKVPSEAILWGRTEGRGGGSQQGCRRSSMNGILRPYGLHVHQTPEVCIALSGQGVIHLGEEIFSNKAPHVTILSPGVVHAEGFGDRQTPYSVLWLQYCSDSSFLATVSVYQTAGRWNFPRRYPLRMGMTRSLFSRICSGLLDHDKQRRLVRYDILRILLELERREILLAKNPPCSALEHHRDILQRVLEYLEIHFTEPIDIHHVAAFSRFSPNYLNTLFARWTGHSFHEYLINRRMEQAMNLCREGQLMIKEIAARCGYDDPLYFSRAFRRYHGCQPSHMLKQRGEKSM